MLNAAQIKKDWEKRGFSFGIWEDSPGQVWKDYVHDTDELFMLVEGEVSVTLNGKTIAAIVGEEIFIPAGSMHTVVASHTLYVEFWSQFADCAQVVFLDQRGCGCSDACDSGEWNLAHWGRDVFNFCEALGVKKPIIAGVSMGDQVLYVER